MTLTDNYLETQQELIKDDILANWSHHAIGTDGTAATSSDTSLGSEVHRNAEQEDTENADSVVVSGYFTSTEANGNTIREHGVFDASSGGEMKTRNTHTDINKTNEIELWYDVKVTVNVTQG